MGEMIEGLKEEVTVGTAWQLPLTQLLPEAQVALTITEPREATPSYIPNRVLPTVLTVPATVPEEPEV